MRISFLTREGCSVCAAALPRARMGAALALRRIEVVDVDSDAELQERFGGRVPVLLSPAGDVLAEGIFSTGDVRRAIRTAGRPGKAS